MTTATSEIGILFVHGIGQQKRGETLVEFGEPLHRWMSRWLAFIRDKWLEQNVSKEELKEWFDRVHGAASNEEHLRRYEALRPLLDRAKKRPRERVRRLEDLAKIVGCNIVSAQVRLLDAALLPIPNELEAPPQASLDLLLLMADGTVQQTRWQLAESWWADAFTAPRFTDLAWWGLVVLPWTVASHFGARLRRAIRDVSKARGVHIVLRAVPLLLRFLEFFIGLVVVLGAVEVVLLLLLLLTPIRIARVGAFIARAQRVLAAIVGDSYAIVSRPIQAAAIVGQVQRDLRWLTARCTSVVIVAHSQGGAVAHLALRSDVPTGLKTLLTFGSGLRKLEELRLAEASRELLAGILSFFGVTLVLGAVVLWIYGALYWTAGVGIPGLLLMVAGMVAAVRGIADDEMSYWASLFRKASIEWEDYYASADPVPNGPLLDEDEDGLMNSVEVRNRASVLQDHTSYWQNVDQFVSSVACAISRHSRIDLKTTYRDGETLERAHRRRRWRAEWLRWTKWAVTMLMAVIVILRRSDLIELGKSLRTGSPQIPKFPGADTLTSVATFWNLVGDPADQALGFVVIVATALAILWVITLCWTWWTIADIAVFFARGFYARRSLAFFVFCAMVGSVLTFGASTVVPPLWSLMTTQSVGSTVGATVASGLFLSGIVMFVVGRMDKRDREDFARVAKTGYDAVPAIEPDAANLVPPDIQKKLHDVADTRKGPNTGRTQQRDGR